MTTWCITEYLKGRSGALRPQARRFFTKVAAVVSGRAPSTLSEADRAAVWNAISFYNYIPRVAATGRGMAPPEHLWSGEAPHVFARVLTALEVEAILVCGERLWDRLPLGLSEAPAFTFEGRQRTARRYAINEPYRAVAAPMWHPSTARGWTVARWRPVVEFLLEQVKLQRDQIHLGASATQ